ncbi:Leucine-rich repeat-containing protein [Ooceraea biroi]|nr:Leucine-rich repeat-containing protein [Ooceraea biroi]
MSILLFNGFLLLGFVVATVPDRLVLGSPSAMQAMEPPVKKCRYSRIRSMLQADCDSLELHDIPHHLQTDIQILLANVNRLRELTNESLAYYKNLAYLYLRDNFIQTIEESAFANQHYLEVLDLSQNGCDSLPKSLFQLPYLRTLYLGHNKLTDSVFKVEVTSPLVMLQLTKNKLTKLPDMGPQPTLTHLNVSDNVITTISTEELASYCSLKVLDLSKNPIKVDDNCECQTLNTWLKLRRINVYPDSLDCSSKSSAGNEECNNQLFNNRTYELYNECSSIIEQKAETEKARTTWIIVASGLSVMLFVLFVVLFCVHKRNRRRRRKQKQQQQLAANNANTELLNSNLAVGNS